MNGIAFLVLLFVVFAIVLGVIAFVAYRRVLRKAKGIERGLKMVPLLIHLPPPDDEDASKNMRDSREIMRERVGQAQVLYDLIAGTAQHGFKSRFYGQRHIAFEIIASNGLIHFFAAVPIALVSPVEQAILTAYPGAKVEEVEDHNIFNPQGQLTGTTGGELVLRADSAYPISTVANMDRDPIEGLINALSKLQLGEGAAVQFMIRPARKNWEKKGEHMVAAKRRQRQGALSFTATDIARATVKSPDQWHQEAQQYQPSKLEETILQGIEEKMRHPGFEILARVVVSSSNFDKSNILLRNVINSFAAYELPGSNGFKFLEARDIQGLVTAFIFRFFPPEVTSNVVTTPELATIFHLPDPQFNAIAAVERQQSKQVDGPVNLPARGLLMGYNFYRGVKKEVRLSAEDRRRHMYIIGQTGTGKSTILENMIVQDMLAGNGLAFIDPHGDAAEKILSMVPKERAEDVIYFNPADTEHPLGLNLFEFDSPEQKDFIVQESINMLYKMYDPEQTGIIGPRFEHWFRSAALTLMADPEGASFIEIPKVFTDTEYLKKKFKYLTDPVVIEFWTKEMAQTSDYHKSEMLGWFVSKFGAFQSNQMMRNIIGQTESAFNIRDIMDQRKILIVNLSKGLTGELNSKLLGILFVIKTQIAAMSRANVGEDTRSDFTLYVDEFQNFSTDSFATILSEARKYHLNLIVANQFIGQLTDDIREAVFGNVGTVMSYRSSPEDAEFLAKQFDPIFNEHDLINLPNFNAVMKLLVGGLPSQPFSITAMPPLGQVHKEMGLAVKQLSAAKFGVSRQQVEADIFARMQNRPRPMLQPPVPQPAAATASAPSVPAPAAATPPVSPPQSPTVPAPVSTPPQPEPAPTPPQPTPSLVPTSTQPQPAPTPAPTPTPTPTIPAPPQPNKPASTSISDIVGPIKAPVKQQPEVKLIEAHEADGRVDPVAPAPASAASVMPKTEPAPAPQSPPYPVPISAQSPPQTAAPASASVASSSIDQMISNVNEELEHKYMEEPVAPDAPTTPLPPPAPTSPSVSPSVTLSSGPKVVPRPVSAPSPVPAPKPQVSPKPTPQTAKTLIATHRSHRLQGDDQPAQEMPGGDQISEVAPELPVQPLSEPAPNQPKAYATAAVPTGRPVESAKLKADPTTPTTAASIVMPPANVKPITEIAREELASAKAETKSTPTPDTAPVASNPGLKPGEVFVDDNGNVIQG